MQFDFLQYLIIGLIGLLFAKDYLLNIISQWLGISRDSDKLSDSQILQGKMDYLKMHFNDELTKILTELQVGQVEVLDILRDMQRNGIRLRK